MMGMRIMAGYVHPYIYLDIQLKKLGIFHTHIHTQLIRKFPIKIETNSNNI